MAENEGSTDNPVTAPEPMEKGWPGQPAPGASYSMGSTSPDDQNYDPQKKPDPWKEVGATGLAQYGGFIKEEFLLQLSGDNALRAWREMSDNDAVVGAFMFAITMLLRKVEWRVEPPEAASVAEILAERMKEREVLRQQAQQRQMQGMMPPGTVGGGAVPGGGQQRSGGMGGPAGGMGGIRQPPGQMAPPNMHQYMARPLPEFGGGGPGFGAPGGTTPPGQPGSNPRGPETLPGSNEPARDDTPDGNAGGGPAQSQAMSGDPGTGAGVGPGDQPDRDPKKVPTSNVDVLNKSRRWNPFRKAGAGMSVGGIDSGQALPIDPATGQPMEFPVGAGLEDIDPAAMKAEELAIFVETSLHDMTHSWADLIGQIVTMIAFGFCLPGDQDVMTSDGTLLPAKSVQVGTELMTAQGRGRRVSHVFEREIDEDLTVIKMRNYPWPIRLTGNHVVLTGRGSIPSNQIIPGDTLLRPRWQLTPGGDYASGWLVGLYLAEGHCRKDAVNSTTFSLHNNEVDYVADKVQSWRDAQGLKPHRPAHGRPASFEPQIMRNRPTPNSGRVTYTHPALKGLITQWVDVNTNAHTKVLTQLPTEEDFARGVLEGWRYGDAGVTVNPDLASQMHTLAGALGWVDPLFKKKVGSTFPGSSEFSFELRPSAPCNVDKKWTPEGEAEARRLRSQGATYARIAEYLNVSAMTIWHWLNDKKTGRQGLQSILFKEVVGHLVTEVSQEPYIGTVYDYEIEEDHSFCAGPFAVSNSWHEVIYKKRNGPNPDDPEQGSKYSDGRIGWSKWATRAQETRFRWEFGPHNEILGMWQLAPPKFELRYLPRSKCLHWRTSATKDNPEGRSVLRNAWRSWFLLKRIQEIEAIGVERDLAGIPVAYVPAAMMSDSATPEEKASLNAIKLMVRNIKRNDQEGIVFPQAFDPENKEPLFKLELLGSNGSGTRAFDTDKIITRYEQRIAMTVLADFILLGHEETGARALGETKADLFTTALEAWLDVIADEINTTAIPRLMQMNGEDPSMAPKLTHGKLETVALPELASLITSMASAGAPLFPDEALEDFLREKGGMPPKAAADDL